MKVLYICTYFHEALLYRQQLDGLNSRGHEVYAFNSAKYGAKIGNKFKGVFDEKVVHVECWSDIDRILFFPRQLKIHKELLKAYNPREFDLIHAHLLVTSGLSARKIKMKYGVPYVVSVRTTDLIGWIRLPFFRRMAIKNASESDGILFLSDNHRNEFLNKYVSKRNRKKIYDKSVVIGNPLERFWQENVSTESKVLEDKHCIRILTVARICKVKNIPTACNAVKILINQGFNVKYTVIGAVEDKEEENAVKGYGFVNIRPYMEKEDLILAYKENDIFLLPSYIETFGRVYIEAMSQGLPVIYTKGQGFDGAFAEGVVGYSVAADSPEEIAERVKDIVNNFERISQNCINECKNYFESNIIDQIEDFYSAAIKKEKKRK